MRERSIKLADLLQSDGDLGKLLGNELFTGISKEELGQMLSCMDVRVWVYPAGAFLLRAGDVAQALGIVLDGRAQIVREDLSGNRMILSGLEQSELFGEAFACLGDWELPISVETVTECRVMWLDVGRVIGLCPSACPFHSRLVQNLLRVLAQKNVALNEKVRLLSLRSIRDKLSHYLEGCAERAGSRQFSIPFNRNQLAEYLGVDRSALSRELSRMRDAGLLQFEKNRFQLL